MVRFSLGPISEKRAASFLRKKGFKILSTNFRSRFGEIDIIAREADQIVFVEVKSRSSNAFGTPLEAISVSKLEKIKKTAYIFLTVNKLHKHSFRFDAVEVFQENTGETRIEHLVNITL